MLRGWTAIGEQLARLAEDPKASPKVRAAAKLHADAIAKKFGKEKKTC